MIYTVSQVERPLLYDKYTFCDVNGHESFNDIQVAIAQGFHLFPFRTEKLSLPAPMVLHTRGRVGSRRFSVKPFESNLGGLFCFVAVSCPRSVQAGGREGFALVLCVTLLCLMFLPSSEYRCFGLLREKVNLSADNA